MRRLPFPVFFLPALAFALGGCVINMGAGGSSGSGSALPDPKAEASEFSALPPDKLPANAAGLNVVYGESSVTDITSKDFPDVVVRGKSTPAELRNVRITAMTSVSDGAFGKVSQIQIYNAGVRDLEITIRTFGLDADGILRARKEEHQLLRARDIVVPEATGWNEAPGSKLRYTIILE